MFKLAYSQRFRKDYKRYKHRYDVISELEKIADVLITSQKLPVKHFNHKLSGNRKDCFECHIKPDVLLVYKIKKQESIILLLRMGSHSEIF